MGVFVPGPPIKRIKRSKAKIVDKNKVEDDGTMCLSPTQQTDRSGRVLKSKFCSLGFLLYLHIVLAVFSPPLLRIWPPSWRRPSTSWALWGWTLDAFRIGRLWFRPRQVAVHPAAVRVPPL